MLVSSILNGKGRQVAACKAGLTLREASERLARENIGALVVLDEGGRIEGILSERDIVRAIANQGAHALSHPIGDYMTRAVVTCSPNDTAEDLMRVMTLQRLRHLPVLEGQKLAGIVSIGDIVKHRLGELELERRALVDYVAGS
jgi:CBS domain-containing protein